MLKLLPICSYPKCTKGPLKLRSPTAAAQNSAGLGLVLASAYFVRSLKNLKISGMLWVITVP